MLVNSVEKNKYGIVLIGVMDNFGFWTSKPGGIECGRLITSQ